MRAPKKTRMKIWRRKIRKRKTRKRKRRTRKIWTTFTLAPALDGIYFGPGPGREHPHRDAQDALDGPGLQKI